MIVIRELPDNSMISPNFRCLTESSVLSNKEVIPRTPFIGVRISWLILARNSDFALVADSAIAFDTCSSLTILSSFWSRL